jgi:serine/threonine-protein kinase SRPK3
MASISLSGPSPPIKFPKSDFVLLNTEERIEEETLPFYNSDAYYPVHIGQVFKSRYQVTTKLGYGVNSTVWLCRDLK